ncbi:hypothetical protein O6H91_02G124300 [Diphasiastrum complanatum]|uniref:Uncharacterized protein n=1 Tax=Diphasiastrum complanatum TaxID=34168 RepID=A0ACC2EJY9_DIPCM|nr:hypothetical protein O6H91_02G124300 [Diphasiastrum complanatum]
MSAGRQACLCGIAPAWILPVLPPCCNGGRSVLVPLHNNITHQQPKRKKIIAAFFKQPPIPIPTAARFEKKRCRSFRAFTPLAGSGPYSSSDYIEEYPSLARFDVEYPNDENLFLATWKFMISILKEMAMFLKEQPEQIKYIEWPSFKVTVKLAILTLGIVILLTIFLTTVDSTFSFLFARSVHHPP